MSLPDATSGGRASGGTALPTTPAPPGIPTLPPTGIGGTVLLLHRPQVLAEPAPEHPTREVVPQVLVAAHTDEVASPAPRDALPFPPPATAADHVSRETSPAPGEAALRTLPHPGRNPLPRPATTRLFTVANQKGGVGKTTSAVNLAAGLALQGASVLVVDLDPQGNASTALGVGRSVDIASVYEVLIEGRPLAEVVQPVPGVPRLQCAPATIDLAGAEIELVPMVARETRLQRALGSYLHERQEQGEAPLDYVFIDCPPSLGLLTVNALVAAGEVLIPIQCEYYALEGLGQLLRNVELVRAHLNPELQVSTILLTMFDARTRLASQVADEVRAHFPAAVLTTSIPRSVRISEAPSYGQTVMTYDPASSGALSYLEAARELARRATMPGEQGQEGRIR